MAEADHQVNLAEREAERQRILQENELQTEERKQKVQWKCLIKFKLEEEWK